MDPLKQIRLVKHGTVCLSDGETTIYVDPYQLDHTARDADLIVITHGHSDHFSPEDIEKICQPDTCFAAPPDVAEMLESPTNTSAVSPVSRPASATSSARPSPRWKRKTRTIPSTPASALSSR